MWAWLIHLIVSIQTSKVRLANNVKLFKGAKGAYPCNWIERPCPIKNSPIDAVFEIPDRCPFMGVLVKNKAAL